MKYMVNGGFQKQKLMKLTLLFTLVFLTGFWVTNFALYFAKMGLTPQSVRDYYLGSEELFRMPRTYQSMLEVTHGHLAMMALVVLLVTHLLIFAPYRHRIKVGVIAATFSLGLLNEGAGWLVRFVSPGAAWLKVAGFLAFQALLGLAIAGVARFLMAGNRRGLPFSETQKAEKNVTQV